MGEVRFRQGDPAETRAAFEVFRGSLWAYVQQIGIVPHDVADDVDTAYSRQGPLMEHLHSTGTLWVAEDDQGELVGLAMSIERDGHLQLTHFFVSPDAQQGGLGRGLLERAFPLGRGDKRSIIATQHPRALGLYLRFGVRSHGVAATFEKSAAPVSVETDLVVEPLTRRDESVELIVSLESEILGYRRPEDIAFLIADRPAVVLRRGGAPVGYAFGSNGLSVGPGGTLDPADLPVALAHMETSAHDHGQGTVFQLCELGSPGVDWMLDHGYHIDPFYEHLLTNEPFIRHDRYLMTQPSFIW